MARGSEMFNRKRIKRGEIAVNQQDFGFLVEEFISKCLRPNNNIDTEWLDKRLREWWLMLEEYDQRRIMTSIEVAIMLDEPPRYSREEMEPVRKLMWQKFVKDLRPPKHPFTIDYRCGKCHRGSLKLWRGVHGCADDNGNKLLCANCLAPDLTVSQDGRAMNKSLSMETDQINDWLPAIPVGDTFWGYSSVPSQDVEWWRALPTYKGLL